jgi:L-ascorbate metabolism protein UlaG (beta-lactamase superfamily)
MFEIKWLGWSGFKVKVSGKTIYFDPVTGEYDEPGDFILISHSHADHSDLKILSAIRQAGSVVLTSRENQEAVHGTGMASGESLRFESIVITACPAYNIVRMSKPGVPFHPRGFGVGWILESGGKTLYHMGDTELIPEMANMGPIDVMLIPISGTYVMDIDEAVKAVRMIRPKVVIPMHYGEIDVVFGDQPTHLELKADPLEFASLLSGITEVRVLSPGETIAL